MIKVAVIGLGVGEAHAHEYQHQEHCELIAICDFNEAKLLEVGKKFPGVRLELNAQEILTDPTIDAVSICTYDSFHFEQIELALLNNKHVFVEKPFVQTHEQAKKILDILKLRPHLHISSNLILRKYPRFLHLKSEMDAEKLGEVYYLEGDYNYGRIHKIIDGWRGKEDFYSIVAGGGIHLIDLFLWLKKKKVTEVFAIQNKIVTRDSDFKFADFVLSVLEFEDGSIAKVSCNFGCVYPHFHPLAIYGTRKTFLHNLTGGTYITSRDPNADVEKLDLPYPGVGKGGHINNFIRAIKFSESLEVSRADIFNAMAICFAIEESLRYSKKSKVNYYF